MSTDIEIRRDPANCAGQDPELLLRHVSQDARGARI